MTSKLFLKSRIKTILKHLTPKYRYLDIASHLNLYLYKVFNIFLMINENHPLKITALDERQSASVKKKKKKEDRKTEIDLTLVILTFR